ncbi:MAG: hypothetical protein G8D88_13825 [gamma proteobacterium symbiont of Ctena orbiculata]
MINTLKKAWGYRPFRDPLKHFGSEAYDSAENIGWTFAEPVRRLKSKRMGITKALSIVNSFTDEQCQQHFRNKPVNDLIDEYRGHRRMFNLAVFGLLFGLYYSFSADASMTIFTMVYGPGVATLSAIYMLIFGWRCWQARVGGNYPPHRFIAALLRNPLQIFP